MALKIKRNVVRSQMWARIFLTGPSGSGKTRGAFELGSRLLDGSLPIVLLNTEPNRGEMYADRFPIEALIELDGDFHPDRFVEGFDAAEQIAPGGVLILDSATHEWYGTNGITQQASRFGDWAKARPLHQTFVDRMQQLQMHVIVCCRAKMKYEQVTVDDGRGGSKPSVVALGVGPMQDADYQYEFSLVGQIDRVSHECEWSGHIDALEGTTSNIVENADALASTISTWLATGTEIVPPVAAAEEDVAALVATLLEEGHKQDVIEERLTIARRENRGALHPDYVADQLTKAKDRLAKKAADAARVAAATATEG